MMKNKHKQYMKALPYIIHTDAQMEVDFICFLICCFGCHIKSTV